MLRVVSFTYPEGGEGVASVTFAIVTVVGKFVNACDIDMLEVMISFVPKWVK